MDEVISYFMNSRFSEGLKCVHCQSNRVILYGKYKGKQRFKCKSCSKTFNIFTKTPFSWSHHLDKWPLFIDCLLKSYSLRKSQSIVGVSYVSLFYWRHKILNFLKLSKITEMKGTIQADDFSLAYSEKGNKKIFIREPRRRAVDYLFNTEDTIYVLVASDNFKNIISTVAANKSFNRSSVDTVLGPYINKSHTLCCNLKSAYTMFSYYKHIKFHRISAVPKDGVFNINFVRCFSRNFKKWLKPFNGVATKYLNNYLCLHKFLFCHDFNILLENILDLINKIKNFNLKLTNSIILETKFIL